MFPVYYTVFLLAKVLIAFFILYIYLPSRLVEFDDRGNDWTDKVMIPLTHSNFIIIILVHILVLFKIYETISLFILIVLLVSFIIRGKSKKGTNESKRSIFSLLLDFADKRTVSVGTRLKGFLYSLRGIPKKLYNGAVYFVLHPFNTIAPLFVFAVAAVTRFSHSFRHLYYGASDCYVHLAWTKYLGINSIYSDGIYPHGYEAVISALEKLFFIDPAVIIRFFGGLGSMLMIFSIYYILRKNLSNKYLIIFIGVAAYVLGTELPNASNNVWRQISALPQEYAMIFILPGLHFLNQFFITGRKKYLVLASEALAITLFIHFYSTLFMGIGYFVLFLLNAKQVFRVFGSLLVYMGGAVIISILPIATALIMGLKFHSLSLSFVEDSAAVNSSVNWRQALLSYTETSSCLRLMLGSACIIVIYSLIRLVFRKDQKYLERIKLFITIALLTLFCYTQVRALEIGFPTVMEYSRASTFLALFIASLYAMAIYIVEYFPFHKSIKYIAFIAMGTLVLTSVYNPENRMALKPEGARMEYDEAAYIYYKIKDDFPVLNWTIVSPVEQYQQSMGFGWHYNLWEFVHDTQIEPKSKVTFPTDYVFILVEKRPLNQALGPDAHLDEITREDALKPFPEVGSSLEKFYTIYDNRKIVEAKAYYWMEERAKSNFTVYYENDNIKVYMLKQDGTKPVNLAVKGRAK